jgi:hypothetical protein
MDRLYTPAHITKMSLAERSEWVLDFVSRHSDLSQHSRISCIAKAALQGQSDIIAPSRPEFAQVVQAQKDLRELQFIVEMLKPSPATPALWSKLKRVFGDHPLPSDSRPESDARDYQFELLVMGMLSRAGLNPQVQPDGADFLCDLAGDEFVVEAKRVKSPDKIIERIRKASKQVHRSGLPGFIALDFAQAVNPGNNQVLACATAADAQIEAAIVLRFRKFWSDLGKRIEEAVHGTRTIGVTFFDHLIVHNGLVSGRINVGNWELATIRDCKFLGGVEGDSRLADTYFDLTNYLGLPAEIR